MFDHTDSIGSQMAQTESYAAAALPYDFNEQAARQKKRDDESRAEHRASKGPLRTASYPETCERCGKGLEVRVYIWNRKRLCRGCVEEGQKTWELISGRPNAAPQRVLARPPGNSNRRSLMESFISEFLALFGLKRIEKEARIPDYAMPIMRERLPPAQRPDKNQMPESEGIMGKKNPIPAWKTKPGRKFPKGPSGRP